MMMKMFGASVKNVKKVATLLAMWVCVVRASNGLGSAYCNDVITFEPTKNLFVPDEKYYEGEVPFARERTTKRSGIMLDDGGICRAKVKKQLGALEHGVIRLEITVGYRKPSESKITKVTRQVDFNAADIRLIKNFTEQVRKVRTMKSNHIDRWLDEHAYKTSCNKNFPFPAACRCNGTGKGRLYGNCDKNFPFPTGKVEGIILYGDKTKNLPYREDSDRQTKSKFVIAWAEQNGCRWLDLYDKIMESQSTGSNANFQDKNKTMQNLSPEAKESAVLNWLNCLSKVDTAKTMRRSVAIQYGKVYTNGTREKKIEFIKKHFGSVKELYNQIKHKL